MDATPTPPTFRPLSEDERRTLVAEARKWQPDRPPDRAAYWRGEVDRNWRGTALDDERALLVVNARPSALLAAVPLFSTYVSQLAELTIDFPRSDALRAALEREEKVRAVWALEWIAETERLRGACLVKRTQAAAIASQLKGPHTEVFWELRAETIHRLRQMLRLRHPAGDCTSSESSGPLRARE
jgi:hypothetical protein